MNNDPALQLALPPELQRVLAQCQSDPVHVARDTTRASTPTSEEALSIVYLQVLPVMAALMAEVDIPWMDHVFEATVDLEHIVMPRPMYVQYRSTLLAAGFKLMPDQRQFACADGLEEALRAGAQIGKKWE
jgi:hypothetical protein